MSSYNSVDVLCPYYQYEDTKHSCMICEGMLPGSTMRSRFRSGAALRRHLAVFCCDAYEKCPWCRILMQKYST